jgi:cytochrome c-type biogenesis protein CcmH/NrfG
LNDPAKAVAEAQAEIQADPKSLAGYLQLGQIFLEHNTPQPAVDIFSKAIQLAPDALLAHLGEGLAFKGIQQFDKAEAELALCLKRDPAMTVAFDALASLYLESANYAQLGTLAEQYLQKNPSDYRGYYYLAAVREHEPEQGSSAEALLKQAIEFKPDFAASYALLGKVLLQEGRAAEAARELEHAVQLRPDYRPAHLYLGNAYRKLGREADAAREFDLVRKLNDEQSTQPTLRYHQAGPPR